MAAAAAREIFAATLADLRVDHAFERCLRREGERLAWPGGAVDLRRFGRVVVIAIGKAARPMCAVAAERLGARLDAGLCVTGADGAVPAGFELIVAGHPVPDEGSVRAGRRALELAATADRADGLVLFLVSGGGSALCELPVWNGWTLPDLAAVHHELVTCGAVIAEINAVRRRLSKVKGGGLARAAARATRLAFYVSDVNPGDVAAIASGPALPDPSPAGRAAEVVARYGLRDRLPPAALAALAEPPPLERGDRGVHVIVLDNRVAVHAMVGRARAAGFRAVVDPRPQEEPVAACALGVVESLRRERDRVAIVSGGEPVCPVRGPGRGGRNQELALRIALELDGRPDAVAVLCAGTDGVDGNSDAAGAVVDASTCARARELGLDPRDHLRRSDSHPLLAATGAAIVTGPTGNNVRDLRLALRA